MRDLVKLLFSIYLLLIVCNRYINAVFECNQRLYESKGNPAKGSNGFALEIYSHSTLSEDKTKLALSDKPVATGYVPGKTYRITLRGWRTQFFVQTFRGFGITTVFENNLNKTAGQFEVKKVLFKI